MAKINIGDLAPDFELLNQDGHPVRLADYLGKKNIVLYFYPKDETPGCVKEACGFRDSYEDFGAAGAEVLGVSADSVDSHKAFQRNRRLPFQLLSDPDNELSKKYGVTASLMGFLPGRETFVIGKTGRVLHHFSSHFQIDGHISEALDVLKTAQE